jgi:lysozyme
MIPGIDVSHWKQPIEWTRVQQAGYRYSFTKATDGINSTDNMFTQHTAGAASVGMINGAYHYYQNENSPDEQAAWFAKNLKSCPVDLPPVLDYEDPSGMTPALTAANVRRFLQVLENLTGRKPIIYTNYNSWVYAVGSPAWSTEYPLWVANYTTAAQPLKPKPWITYQFWQYTSHGAVPGIPGDTDLDWLNGTLAELYALAGKPIEPEITHADIMAKLVEIEALIKGA